MKKRFIKIKAINDAVDLSKNASHVEGDVLLMKGKYIIDVKSLMGIMSIDTSTGVTIEYPEDEEWFDAYLMRFEE